MFYPDQTSAGFLHARDEHFINVRYVIKKKLLGNRFKEAHPKGLPQKIDQVTGIHASVANFFNNESHLKKLLIGTPNILDSLKSKFQTPKEKASVKLLVRYDTFIDKKDTTTFRFYNAYHLAENLRQHTCVYCNRLYTQTIITENREFVARPTFDHWFPKGDYPLLALSFYNLVPSCSVCNSSIKGSTALSLSKIFHPYLKHQHPRDQMDFRFSFDLEDHTKAEGKLIANNVFSQQSIDTMRLAEMYSVHAEEIRELIYLKKAYSESYLHSLRSILKTPVSNEEIYRLAFGVYVDDDLLYQRPLSKLKKDILTELGLIG
ncbi:hypothetical protein SAMN05216464_11040 [Mucilaginibacter pineti]|uniref:HNH endonuclease n=1 Tax=Mucilaginibacter pineti TaxID=1391627 RepID=A0A1G7G9U2_9SPHI|nr:hypothetical protein [Mucilaginibacter pineti]SDE84881.1 hypothetical protein SAMN05216464_11040 [Mucilaginibacter pineti]